MTGIMLCFVMKNEISLSCWNNKDAAHLLDQPRTVSKLMPKNN